MIYANKKTFFALTILLGFFKVYSAFLIPDHITQDWIKGYTQSDKMLIDLDCKIINDHFFRDKTAPKKPLYLGTAGGPGSMKSTILETYLIQKTDNNFIRADPDIYGLRYMVNTYIPSTSLYAQSQSSDYLRLAYEKWRGGSNYIANSLLNSAFNQGYNIAHGTTATSPHIGKLYESLKNKGYRIELLLCDTTDANRAAAVFNREKTFYQSTPQDAIDKSKMFYERLPTYFQYADTIIFYWTDEFKNGSIVCGIWTPSEGLQVKDEDALNKFVNRYENYVNANKKLNLPLFRALCSTTQK